MFGKCKINELIKDSKKEIITFNKRALKFYPQAKYDKTKYIIDMTKYRNYL